jgi:hypothetical protein
MFFDRNGAMTGAIGFLLVLYKNSSKITKISLFYYLLKQTWDASHLTK